MTRLSRWLGASASVIGLLTATGALAQATTSTPAPSAGAANERPAAPAASADATAPASTVGEVMVTAERRTTNLQTTPIAATVLN